MVDTSRLSTRRGEINFLNFPADKETRNCFEANEENVMVVCDFQGQENTVSADLSGDEAMTNSVVNGDDLHCAFARVLYPEIKDLSDEDIMENHKHLRQLAKSPRFLFAYGGSAFTLHQNHRTPLEEAKKIENSFKELHKGLYEWGEQVLQEAISKGYIESAAGWKLKLPEFKRFKALEAKIQSISKNEWMLYREGKEENKKLQEDINYKIKNNQAFEFYSSRKKDVSSFFKLKGEYMRLALNNPVQSRSAHQLKLSVSLLFEWIENSNLLGKVLIDNIVHDKQICCV
jgi:DNA polymerase I-like protein with 3'-5' exonuclease and polymerase domains